MLRALPGLGDALCAVPALHALRRRFPEARITYAGLACSSWLAERFPHLVDHHWDLPALPGLHPLPARRGTVAAVFRDLSREGFDLALQLHGDGTRSDAYATAMGAGLAIGPGWVARTGGGRTSLDTGVTDPAHEVDRLLAVVAQLGCCVEDRRATFPVLERDREAVRRLLRRAGRVRPYAVLHPGASRPEHRWPLDGFTQVGRALAPDLRTVVTGTTEEEALGASLSARVPRSVNLTGRTGLGELAALLEGATVVVGNDTGTAQLAAAVGVPSVVVVIDGDVDRWGPPGDGTHRVVPSRTSGSGLVPWSDLNAVLHAVVDVLP